MKKHLRLEPLGEVGALQVTWFYIPLFHLTILFYRNLTVDLCLDRLATLVAS